MTDNKSWTCGFCQEVLSTWDARATHIATHFKAGLTMAHWRERRVSQSTLPQEHTKPEESMTLDDLAAMGATFAGPSNYRSAPASHARIGSAQHQQLQPTPTATFMSAPTTVPDININAFSMYGNTIDAFDPSLSYYPAVSTVSAPAQTGEASSMDFGVVGVDEFGNPLYDLSLFHTW